MSFQAEVRLQLLPALAARTAAARPGPVRVQAVPGRAPAAAALLSRGAPCPHPAPRARCRPAGPALPRLSNFSLAVRA